MAREGKSICVSPLDQEDVSLRSGACGEPSAEEAMMTNLGLPMILASVLSAFAVQSPFAVRWPEKSGPPIYISPRGDDSADGLTRNSAMLTPERAQAKADRLHAAVIYLLGGVFSRATPISIKATSSLREWRAFPGEKPVLEGNGKVSAAFTVQGTDVVIEGLQIQNFRDNGIVIKGASGVVISNNEITDIASSRWNEAGILGMQAASNVVISRNSIRRTGYSGVQFAASVDGDISNPKIINNSIEKTCQVVPDCGAIYVTGRPSKPVRAVISGNEIADYGPPTQQTKAVYLDDNASGAVVERNRISGRGSYPIAIHGGSNNQIRKNVITTLRQQKVIFSQSRGNTPSTSMTGNRIEENTINGVASSDITAN
ncbi:right-handed parallel beta-helix repeat-containing protein [Sphingomonas koreensis]|nr:right-handed parallel beta-helix repeat-containing protein [Sphingomonas koreensis]